MTGVSRNFGSLLRDARWTRWHKEQVYTAPQAFRITGDWGFKQRMTSPYAYGRLDPAKGAKLGLKAGSHAAAGGPDSNPRTAAATAEFVAGGAKGNYVHPGTRTGVVRYVKVRNLTGTFDNKVRFKETERAVQFRRAWFDKGAHTKGFKEAEHERRLDPSQGVWSGKPAENTRSAGSLGLPPRTVFDSATLTADVSGKHGTPAVPRKPTAGLKIPGLESAPALAPQEPASTTEIATEANAATDEAWGVAPYIYGTSLSAPNYRKLSSKQFNKFIDVLSKQKHALVEKLSESQKAAVKRAIATKLKNNAVEAAKSDPEVLYAISQRSIESWEEEVPPLDTVKWSQPDLWNAARSVDRTEVNQVLLDKSTKSIYGRGSHSKILPYQLARDDRIHPSSGLMFAQPDEVFTNVLNDALPGRVLPYAESSQTQGGIMSRLSARRTSALAVSSGGHIELVPSAVKQMLLNWNLRRSVNPHSESKFRVMEAAMITPEPPKHKVRNTAGFVTKQVNRARSELARATFIPKPMGAVQAKSRPVQDQAEGAHPSPGTSYAVGARIHRQGGQASLSSLKDMDARLDAQRGTADDKKTADSRAMDLDEMIKGVNSVLRGGRR